MWWYVDFTRDRKGKKQSLLKINDTARTNPPKKLNQPEHSHVKLWLKSNLSNRHRSLRPRSNATVALFTFRPFSRNRPRRSETVSGATVAEISEKRGGDVRRSDGARLLSWRKVRASRSDGMRKSRGRVGKKGGFCGLFAANAAKKRSLVHRMFTRRLICCQLLHVDL